MGLLSDALDGKGRLQSYMLNPQFATATGKRPEELRAYDPSIGEKLSWILQEGLTALGLNKYDARHLAEFGSSVASMTPAVGIPMVMEGASRSAGRGDYLGAGLELAMFAGPGAKIANKAALKTAKEMLEGGATREAIWDATGWFKGADDKWRFEIPDSASVFQGISPEPQKTPIRAALKHPELYKAYPDLVPATVSETSLGKGAHGEYRGGVGDGEDIAMSWTVPGKDRHSTLLHEVQHAVQEREGFARGGNTMSLFGHSDPKVRKAVEEEWDRLLTPISYERYKEALKPGWPDGTEADFRKSYDDYLKSNKKSRSNIYDPANKAAQETAAMNVYRRMAGEVESRNVQKRMGMTPEQLRATPPWLTEDVPLDQQIVRFAK